MKNVSLFFMIFLSLACNLPQVKPVDTFAVFGISQSMQEKYTQSLVPHSQLVKFPTTTDEIDLQLQEFEQMRADFDCLWKHAKTVQRSGFIANSCSHHVDIKIPTGRYSNYYQVPGYTGIKSTWGYLLFAFKGVCKDSSVDDLCEPGDHTSSEKLSKLMLGAKVGCQRIK